MTNRYHNTLHLLFFWALLIAFFWTTQSDAACRRYIPDGTVTLSHSRNAYPSDFFRPPNQPWIYVAWVWRETPDVATNHTLSIARSRDLRHWEDSCGQREQLPIRLDGSEVIDPIRPNSGLLNNVKVGADRQGRPIVTYQKYVEEGGHLTTQVFNARLEASGWAIYQMTHWTTAWTLAGGGSLPASDHNIAFSAVNVGTNGQLYQSFRRAVADTSGWPATGSYVLGDNDGLSISNTSYESQFKVPPKPAEALKSAAKPHAFETGFGANIVYSRVQAPWGQKGTIGGETPDDPTKRSFIRWETLPTNRDLPYDCFGRPQSKLTLADQITATCPNSFVRPLSIWTYNDTTSKWESTFIDDAWGGCTAAFDFLTYKDVQIVAYYNRNRQMTVAIRKSHGPWRIKALDSIFQGWDTHNYLTIAVDRNDDIHVVGNVHSAPLSYYRSTGLDVSSLKRLPMTGKQETQVTYPHFFATPDGRFAFMYRDGASGDGNSWINVYDAPSRRWNRIDDAPLFQGKPAAWR